MACTTSQLCFRRFWSNLRSVKVLNCCNHVLHSRCIAYTSCHFKSADNKARNEDDLDFFGLKELELESKLHKNDTDISSGERKFLKSLVEKHVKPTSVKHELVQFDRNLPSNLRHSDTLPSFESNEHLSHQRKKRKTRHRDRNKRHNVEAITNMSVIDEQYFPDVSRYEKVEQKMSDPPPIISEQTRKSPHDTKDMSFIDDQYFEYQNQTPVTKSTDMERHEWKAMSVKDDPTNSSPDLDILIRRHHENPFSDTHIEHSSMDKSSKSSFFDEQFFSEDAFTSYETSSDYHTKPVPEQKQGGTTFISEQWVKPKQSKDRQSQYFESDFSVKSGKIKEKPSREITKKKRDMKHNRKPVNELDTEFSESSFYIDRHESEKKISMPRQGTKGNNVNSEEELSAYNLAMNIRKQHQLQSDSNIYGLFDPKEYDSKGFKILKNQVPHLENVPSVDVVRLLRQSIIYDRHDIIAISKPYGLVSQKEPGILHSVQSFIDRIIPQQPLYMVNKLDKDITGVMLFSKTKEMAERLKECFYKREVDMRYLAITKGVPNLHTGEIDIPLSEGTVNGKTRMHLRPVRTPELKPVHSSQLEGRRAITRYKVLDSNELNCAVLECMPLTMLKRQIRAHLAFGLNCPILGDHKFSHVNKMAPQRLNPDMLDKLKIQQSKVRHLAMHLHCRSIVIPDFLSGRNLFVSAPLPPHFVRNLSDLKLKLPKHS